MSSPLKHLLDRKVAATCGVLGQLLVFVCIAVSILASPWFVWTNNALSDLGNIVTASSAPIFNTGLIIGGIITIFFVLGLGMKVKTHVLGLMGTVALFAVSIGMIGVGIFPENYSLPHFLSAMAIFLSTTVALVFFGVAQLLNKSTKILGAVSLTLSLVTGLVWFLPWGHGIAIPETIASIAMYIWIIITSVRLFTGKDIVAQKQRKTP